jgi:hypothetical protein
MRGHDFSLTWFYGNLSGLCVMEGRETGQGTAGQGGDDVRVADGAGEVGVIAGDSHLRSDCHLHNSRLGIGNFPKKEVKSLINSQNGIK